MSGGDSGTGFSSPDKAGKRVGKNFIVVNDRGIAELLVARNSSRNDKGMPEAVLEAQADLGIVFGTAVEKKERAVALVDGQIGFGIVRHPESGFTRRSQADPVDSRHTEANIAACQAQQGDAFGFDAFIDDNGRSD